MHQNHFVQIKKITKSLISIFTVSLSHHFNNFFLWISSVKRYWMYSFKISIQKRSFVIRFVICLKSVFLLYFILGFHVCSFILVRWRWALRFKRLTTTLCLAFRTILLLKSELFLLISKLVNCSLFEKPWNVSKM